MKLGLALVGGALGLGGWLGYQLVLQHGRLLLRLEALEERLAAVGAGAGPTPITTSLPIGGAAVDFALPDLDGQFRTLSSWRGRRVLLISFDPGCSFCRQLLPELAALPLDASDRPVPLLVTSGSSEQNRALFAEHDYRGSALLQEGREVAEIYHLDRTPMGYLIDEQGLIASPTLIGAPDILALAGLAGPTAGLTRPPGTASDLTSRAPISSRTQREGLPAGSPAPPLELPLLVGGRFNLGNLLGHRVLLVFSDPACGPCLELAPRLERIHQRAGEPRVVMVSRGDPAANRAQADELGLTFPIALQRRWEASRDFGMLATPIGYLIDETGTTAAEVAVGTDAILALAERAVKTSGEAR